MKKKIMIGIAALLCGGILLQQGYIGAQNTAEKEPEAVSSRPVSYTQLDVYKRQIWLRKQHGEKHQAIRWISMRLVSCFMSF